MLISTGASHSPQNRSKHVKKSPHHHFSPAVLTTYETPACHILISISAASSESPCWIRAHTKAGRLINTNCSMLPSETWKKWGGGEKKKKVWNLFDLQETRERWAPMHDLTCKAKCLDKAHHETLLTDPLASVSTVRMLLTTWCFFPKRGIMQNVWSSASHQDGFFSPVGKFFT